MKQLIQNMRTGESRVVEVPVPQASPGRVLVHLAASLVSAGTERMLVDFGRKNIIEKVRARPDLARQTLEKAQREGMLTTLEAVQNRLDQPISLGYSCAGTVIEVGAGVSGLQVGDRVACAGQYAAHAEIVAVPKNLIVKLPEDADFEAAAFTTLGAIALQGIRLAEVTLGEIVAVIGLGLVGQLTVQMLKVAGCTVIGMDIQSQRVQLAQQLGADAIATNDEELAVLCARHSNGLGADSVLITADTKSNRPVEVAGEIARDKGKVVAVGAVGLDIPRKAYYEKELNLRISRSYGPGRYDEEYEEKGHDYPYGYVRWTEQRNMAAVAQMVAHGQIDVTPLITHRIPISEAPRAYEIITGKAGEPFLGVLLRYPEATPVQRRVALRAQDEGPDRASGVRTHASSRVAQVRLGVIGAGNFANATLLPALKELPKLVRVGIASSGGLTARSSGDRFGFAYATTDSQQLLDDPDINTIAILTRHNQHARQVVAALEAGKHVYVEKPLCLTIEELDQIAGAYNANAVDGPALHVGYNRRFSPFLAELRQRLSCLHEPLVLNCRVNGGFIPSNHWVQDPEVGGGRLIGEGCHFIDLLIFLAGNPPRRVTTLTTPNAGRYSNDNLVITIEFVNGSLASLTYVANGDKSYGKEFVEVFGGGVSARMDDYRHLVIREGNKGVTRVARLRQDKGHRAEWEQFVTHLTGEGQVPIPFEEILMSTRAVLAAQRSLELGQPVDIN